MNTDYVFKTTKFVKVPDHRSTEPALNDLFQACYKRNEREEKFNPDNLQGIEREDYLQSLIDELRIRCRAFISNIFEMGRLLQEAKKIIPYGDFKNWIETNFEQGYRTAVNCMRVYEACIGCPEIVPYFQSSCLYIICRPSFDESLRTALFANVKGPVAANKKDIVETVLKYKSGEIKTEDEAVQHILQSNRALDIKDRYRIELQALYKIMIERLGRIIAIRTRHSASPLINSNGNSSDEEMEFAFETEERIERFMEKLNHVIKHLEKDLNE